MDHPFQRQLNPCHDHVPKFYLTHEVIITLRRDSKKVLLFGFHQKTKFIYLSLFYLGNESKSFKVTRINKQEQSETTTVVMKNFPSADSLFTHIMQPGAVRREREGESQMKMVLQPIGKLNRKPSQWVSDHNYIIRRLLSLFSKEPVRPVGHFLELEGTFFKHLCKMCIGVSSCTHFYAFSEFILIVKRQIQK